MDDNIFVVGFRSNLVLDLREMYLLMRKGWLGSHELIAGVWRALTC